MDRIHTGGMSLYPGSRAGGSAAEEPSLSEGLATSFPTRPLYLFADSQLLFWRKGDGELFLSSLREALDTPTPKAAYLGASNGDHPDFYAIFEAAMEGISVFDTRMIPARPSAEDLAYLEEADLILLAGGDVELGWGAFAASGIREVVVRRYYAGALLAGVSAGAVQLGLMGWSAGVPVSRDDLIDTFKFLPYLVDAHAEASEWAELKAAVRLLGESVQGIGIPGGGGVIYHPDHSVEAVRHPCHEISLRDGEVVHSLILPTSGS